MSNYVAYGTITTNTTTDTVTCSGWTTLSAHLDSGAGTWTWEFKGPDGVWRSIYAGTDNLTEQVYTATHMANVFFGSEVRVRATASAGTAPVWDWQLIGNPWNRHA